MGSPAEPKRIYRPLRADEIRRLEAQGCVSTDWGRVRVAAQGFRPDLVREARFSGEIRLGGFTAETVSPDGFPVPLGIHRATLHEVEVGTDVRINNIGSYLAHVEIGDRAIVENVDLLVTEGESSFGQGVRVPVMNEAGGRDVPLYERLTAQVAYVFALYRHRTALLGALERIADTYVRERVRARRGRIGPDARVTNNKTLVNVRIGPGARVKGVLRLREVTVASHPDAPSHLGDGVIAEETVVGAGTRVEGGAVIERSFLGEGVRVGKGFALEKSLVFANAELLNGEGCSVFAGPFTVSHHRGSLLLTALYSFYNAGSGSNFSNHMYKLGPLHQGVIERGGKTGSFSHVYWPSRIGAFSVVIGRHHHHVDTRDLPFSYVIESEGRSLVVPGANLFTAGVRRDEAKWPARDRRPAACRLDRVNPAVWSPFTAGRVAHGQALLARLATETPPTARLVSERGLAITRGRLEKGRIAYERALDRYLGALLADRLEPLLEEGLRGEALRVRLFAGEADGEGEWLDAAGLLLPRRRMETILRRIEEGEADTPAAVEALFAETDGAYAAMAWDWARRFWAARRGCAPEAMALDEAARLLEAWREAVRASNAESLEDAAKEFAPSIRVGFGVDGDEEIAEADFLAVRGRYDEHPFVLALREETAEADRRAARLLLALGSD